MANKNPTTSCSEYLIQISPDADVARVLDRLEHLVEPTVVSGRRNMYVVHLKEAVDDARNGWSKLQSEVGSDGQVQPVFLDDDGRPNYPVGTVQVRFKSPPSDAELRAWVPKELRVAGRNQFVPSQVALEPAEPGKHFLPDLIAELQRKGEHQAQVWPETLQTFNRA